MTKKQLRKTLPANIAKARLACGLSITESADQADISQPYWSMIERGTRRPSLKVLERMAKVLNCTVASLMENR